MMNYVFEKHRKGHQMQNLNGSSTRYISAITGYQYRYVERKAK